MHIMQCITLLSFLLHLNGKLRMGGIMWLGHCGICILKTGIRGTARYVSFGQSMQYLGNMKVSERISWLHFLSRAFLKLLKLDFAKACTRRRSSEMKIFSSRCKSPHEKKLGNVSRSKYNWPGQNKCWRNWFGRPYQ